MQALPSWLNPFDFLIAFALLGGIALGFLRGLIRMAMSLLALYIATVLAMSFYVPVGNFMIRLTSYNMEPSTAGAIAFLLLLIATASLINFILHHTYKDTELPGIRQIDQLGGMVIGFILVTIWIGLCIVALAFLLNTTSQETSALRDNLVRFFHTSNLIPIYYKVLPIALATLRPWMPKGQVPDIFAFRLF
jgi:uncharacterized membrane protein required for colicin V production